MELPAILSMKQEAVFDLCRQYGVARLYVFGSVLTAAFDARDSDLDFVVEWLPMSPMKRGANGLKLQEALEALFVRKVDLLVQQSIRNPYLQQELEATQRLVYEAEDQEIPV